MANNKDSMQKVTLSILNSRCSYCSRVIEQILKKTRGVANVFESYLTDRVLVQYDPYKTSIELLRESVKKLGYDAIQIWK